MSAFMTDQKINSDFCFDSNRKLTIEISHRALKNHHDKFSVAFDLQKPIPIILDTNVLLAYYGMSQSQKEKLIQFLNENKDRIFLTSQIEKEFLRNRLKAIEQKFLIPLNNIQSDFKRTYKDIKNKFENFIDSKKNILSNDYPTIWNSLLEKQQQLNELLEDEEILSKSLEQAIETTKNNYKNIDLVDELLEVCASFKITLALSDEEVKFLENQYDVLWQKYEAVEKPEMKRELTFPGLGDKLDKKEYPYGDFIIFHEILKFMVCGEYGLDKTDVIFLTYEKAKRDWFHDKLAPIIHYIERAFLLTERTLFIIHAEEPLKISLENIYKSNQQELFPEMWSENKLYSIKKDGLPSETYMGHYRGCTISVFLEPFENSWFSIAVDTLCFSHTDFMEVANRDDMDLIMAKRTLTKEEAYTAIKYEIDAIFGET
jgi:hypothetical protein